MTDLNIAAMDAAQKLAYAQAVGSVLLTKGTISEPVAYFDLVLPAGYKKFILELEFAMDPDSLSAALSFDGGVTYVNNISSYDSYGCNYTYLQSGTWSGHIEDNAVFYIGAANNADTTNEFTCVIFPGDANSAPLIRSEGNAAPSGGIAGGGGTYATYALFSSYLQDPTFTGGRANYMRILPEGNDDGVDPPTSSNRILSGSYSLIGVA